MLWLKSLHLFFVVSWFAGIFYLPRIFVNLAASEDQAITAQLVGMAERLYRFMSIPAVLSAVFGFWILFLYWPAYREAQWMHAKLVLVILLVAYHLFCGRVVASFRSGSNRRSHVFYRWFNELPVLILLGVVILVIVRPF